MKKNNPFRILWIALGFLCLGLGSIGILLPILPTVPFYLATVFCFAKSSKRLHDWFIGTGLYKRHLESFVQKKSMSMRSKLSIVGTVTVIMAAGFHDEQCSGRQNLSGCSLGLPFILFFLPGENLTPGGSVRR